MQDSGLTQDPYQGQTLSFYLRQRQTNLITARESKMNSLPEFKSSSELHQNYILQMKQGSVISTPSLSKRAATFSWHRHHTVFFEDSFSCRHPSYLSELDANSQTCLMLRSHREQGKGSSLWLKLLFQPESDLLSNYWQQRQLNVNTSKTLFQADDCTNVIVSQPITFTMTRFLW